MPALIFDYDGTIHDTMRIYEPAFLQCYERMVREGFLRREEIGSGRIAGWLGMNVREMWEDFAPQLPPDIKERFASEIGRYMEEKVITGKACWYAGVEELLDRLKEDGYRMVILSNSTKAAAKLHWRAFDMGRWFLRWYDCESFGWAEKSQIIRQIAADYKGNHIMIGDRYSDYEAARAIGCPFIGCAYGYGSRKELSRASCCAASVEELSNILLVSLPTGVCGR